MTLAEELQAANEWFMTRYGSGDMKNVSQIYAEDCKIMATGYNVLEGRACTFPLFVALRMREQGPLLNDACTMYVSLWSNEETVTQSMY